jgi:hypothetical protein
METKTKGVDLSKILYVIIMAIVLGFFLLGCNKNRIIPAPKYKKSFSSLEDLFNNNFYCYRAKYPDSNTYHFNVGVNNDFLTAFDNPPSEFDLNDDGDVDTQDVLLNLTGFGNPQPEYPPLIDFTPFENFGEGNTWLIYTGDNPDISFGWLHRTPYDETNPPNYIGYENIYTWTLDVVTSDNIIYYYFVEV